MAKVVTIDFETRSSKDLKKVGRHNYMNDPHFKIILMAIKEDNQPTLVLENPTREEVEDIINNVYTDYHIKKTTIWAHNAAFEIGSIEAIDVNSHTSTKSSMWRDTMILCAYHGLPISLENASSYMKLTNGKLTTGKELIDLFTKPITEKMRKKHNVPEDKIFWEKEDFPEKWAMFVEYCRGDVDACYEIHKKLPAVPDFVWDEWLCNLQITRHGISVDRNFCEIAYNDIKIEEERCIEELEKLTGVDIQKSRNKMKVWLKDFAKIDVDSLNKEVMAQLLASDKVNATTKKVLQLFSTITKTSVVKYERFQELIGEDDDKLYDFLNFYGARTGRWSSWGVQIHNMKRLDEMASVCGEIRKEAKAGMLPMFYDDLSYLYSRMIRTTIVAPRGKKLIIADFAQIEARVLQWLAGDQTTLDIFRSGKDYYTYTAATMFNKKYEDIPKDSEDRRKGKVASLALGYGGAVGALDRGAGKDMTLPEKLSLIQLWRKANDKVVKLWATVEAAFIKTFVTKGKVVLPIGVEDELVFEYKLLLGKPAVTIKFPSGRVMWYPDVKAHGNSYVFFGKSSEDQYAETYTNAYGGFLTENITQAIARDCLQMYINRIRNAGYQVAFHVHDEVILEVEDEKVEEALDFALKASKEVIYKGLPVVAEPKASIFYDK